MTSDSGLTPVHVLLDVSAALVDHCILLQSMSQVLKRTVLQWCESYLSDILKFVHINVESSSYTQVHRPMCKDMFYLNYTCFPSYLKDLIVSYHTTLFSDCWLTCHGTPVVLCPHFALISSCAHIVCLSLCFNQVCTVVVGLVLGNS